jgi:transcription antitermination factor NusG
MDTHALRLPTTACSAPNLYTPKWYVAYTYPRHEKAVADQLSHKSVETFLPTYTEMSIWKDRRVKLEKPLFPSYVFARVNPSERPTVLETQSVIRLVSFQGAPAPVEDSEIEAIRLCIEHKIPVLPYQLTKVGDRVRVRRGPFEGVEGIVVRHNNSCKLVVTISLIHQSVALEIAAELLEHVPASSVA